MPGGGDWADEEEGNLEDEEENEPSGTPCTRSPYVNNNNNRHTIDKSYLHETANKRHTTYPSTDIQVAHIKKHTLPKQ